MGIKKIKFKTVNKTISFKFTILVNLHNKYRNLQMKMFYLNHNKCNKFNSYLEQLPKM